MNTREMDRLIAHCDRYFGQEDAMVLHAEGQKPHVDVLRYPPNERYPYWKLVTMGASDYAMPKSGNTLGDRNEYVLFVDPDDDLQDTQTLVWYARHLYLLCLYPQQEKTHITYGHSVEWGEEDDSDMVGAFLEMPQIMEDVGFLRCRLGLFKQTVLLQVIPLTRQETDRLLEAGPEAFSLWLYPESEGRPHFLAQRYRTERF